MVRSRDLHERRTFAAHHFQKPLLPTPPSFVFHLLRALQERLVPSHVCRVAFYFVQSPLLPPLYPYCPYASTELISVVSIVPLCHDGFLTNPCLHVSMFPCFQQR